MKAEGPRAPQQTQRKYSKLQGNPILDVIHGEVILLAVSRAAKLPGFQMCVRVDEFLCAESEGGSCSQMFLGLVTVPLALQIGKCAKGTK